MNALERYLYHLRRWWWLVAVIAGITGVLSFFIASSSTGSYEATTTLLIRLSSTSGETSLDDLVAGERLTKTYTELIKTRPVLEESARRLAGTETADDLDSQVSASPVFETQLIQVTATSDDAARAAFIADTVSAVFVQQQNAAAAAAATAAPPQPTPAAGTPAQTNPTAILSVVEPAQIPGGRSGNSVPVQTVAGIIAGASLVLVVLAARAYFDSSVWNPEDLRSAGLQLPCLGILPMGELGGATLLSSGRAIPALTESSRTVATTSLSALSRLEHETDGCIAVGIVSSARGEGRTSITARLGVAAATEGMTVTLVDFDLRNPELHEEFHVPVGYGITEAMWSSGAGRATALTEIATSIFDGLRLVSAGQDPSLPARRLSTAEVSRTVDQLKSNGASVMFFDTPPLSEGTEAVTLGQVLDAAIIIIEARRTTVESVITTAGQMDALGLAVLGYVLNKR